MVRGVTCQLYKSFPKLHGYDLWINMPWGCSGRGEELVDAAEVFFPIYSLCIWACMTFSVRENMTQINVSFWYFVQHGLHSAQEPFLKVLGLWRCRGSPFSLCPLFTLLLRLGTARGDGEHSWRLLCPGVQDGSNNPKGWKHAGWPAESMGKSWLSVPLKQFIGLSYKEASSYVLFILQVQKGRTWEIPLFFHQLPFSCWKLEARCL